MRKDIYESPLSSRYASEYMLHLFSPDMRFQTWRRLWVALARAEHELGLPITQEQVDELAAHITDIDYEVAEKREHEVRHDVMAHVYAYGKAAPSAAGIIHLGATSCYVTDNADLVLYRDGLKYLRGQLLSVMVNLAAFAREYAAAPTLGYTHYQPAQPVTIGKRATLWMQDFRSDLEELDFVIGSMRFLGCRGTTGTEASFVDLFEGDGDKVDEMNRRIAAEFGFEFFRVPADCDRPKFPLAFGHCFKDCCPLCTVRWRICSIFYITAGIDPATLCKECRSDPEA